MIRIFSVLYLNIKKTVYFSDRDPNSNAIPRFLSRGQTYRVVIGDTLVLPCEVDDLGKFYSVLCFLLLLVKYY